MWKKSLSTLLLFLLSLFIPLERGHSAEIVANNCPNNQLYAEYFAPHNYWDAWGTPVARQCEPTINYAWEQGGPALLNGHSDRFGIRWQGRFQFTSGTYQFHLEADDGLRVWIDGESLFADWTGGPKEKIIAKTMSEGLHAVRVEYFEYDQGATAKVQWYHEQECGIGRSFAQHYANDEWQKYPPLTPCQTSIDGEGSFETSRYHFAVSADNPRAEYGFAVSLAQCANWRSIPATRLLEYDSFCWVIQSADVLPPHATPYTLTLGEQIQDLTQQNAPQRQTDDQPNLRLVQWEGPIRPQWLDTMQQRGITPIQYIHPFTYVVWSSSVALKKLETHPLVRATADFTPSARLLPSVQQMNSTPTIWRVLVYRYTDLTTLGKQLGATTSLSPLDHRWAVVNMALSAEQAAQLSQLPFVYSLQPQPTNGGARSELSAAINIGWYDPITYQPQTGYQTWLTQAGTRGQGVAVANVDLGFDETHPDLIANMLPCTGSTCGGTATNAHGLHTAGIIAGSGASGIVDSAGFLRGLGVAPSANLIEQLFTPTYLEANGLLTLMEQSYTNGATLSSNSWGPSGTPKGYDLDTMQVDIGVRDAVASQAGLQPLPYFVSIMNGYGGTSKQGTPDEAKNAVTIGSTRLMSSSVALLPSRIDDLSHTSAHGPALDGRIIPFVVAPGCYVDSVHNNGGHGFMCGTSMATPQVSGVAALYVQKYREQFGFDPSPAMIKAMLAVFARDLYGHTDANGGIMTHAFNSKQGWGRINAAEVISPTDTLYQLDQSVVLSYTGQLWQQTFQSADPTRPVRIMLTWTDAPGHGLGGTTPAWNNDLDLLVETETGELYYGNAFGTDGWSATNGSADPRNNSEGVFLPAINTPFTITIRASNLTSDAIPQNGLNLDQDFALVATNTQPFIPTFTIGLEKVVYPTTVFVGQTVTYTVTRSLELAPSGIGNELLSDPLPAQLRVITETVTLNGQALPTLYKAETHRIEYRPTSVEPITITFMAQLNSPSSITPLTNTLYWSAELDGRPITQSASATLEQHLATTLYLPLLSR